VNKTFKISELSEQLEHTLLNGTLQHELIEWMVQHELVKKSQSGQDIGEETPTPLSSLNEGLNQHD